MLPYVTYIIRRLRGIAFLLSSSLRHYYDTIKFSLIKDTPHCYAIADITLPAAFAPYAAIICHAGSHWLLRHCRHYDGIRLAGGCHVQHCMQAIAMPEECHCMFITLLCIRYAMPCHIHTQDAYAIMAATLRYWYAANIATQPLPLTPHAADWGWRGIATPSLHYAIAATYATCRCDKRYGIIHSMAAFSPPLLDTWCCCYILFAIHTRHAI